MISFIMDLFRDEQCVCCRDCINQRIDFISVNDLINEREENTYECKV